MTLQTETRRAQVSAPAPLDQTALPSLFDAGMRALNYLRNDRDGVTNTASRDTIISDLRGALRHAGGQP